MRQEPRINRSLTLHLQGDWGMQNLHRVCGWISQELTDRSASGTRVAIWNGRGFTDNVRAVGEERVDLALATPAAFVTAALDGRGPYRGQSFPDLRAIAAIPQRDRLVVAVRRSVGVTSFEELRQAKPALRVATSLNDGVNHVGLAAHEVLDRSGADIAGWGGRFLEDERPFDSFEHVLAGRADAVIHEAIMLPHWQEFGRDMHFLPIEREVLAGLERDLGWPDAMVPAGYFPGAPELRTLDFSDFLVLARADLAEDVAHALAWILGETRQLLEQQYAHIPSERSPVTYPLDPHAMGRTPIPLHPGAARYYESL
ncbi:TAXI family TRAP transporter solute-binding subunit [Nonomuraea lactucae]|uniref:TAXI family TRAP transporter solute-binding subunit n=1 Tax=Nonomuraea lactucae TaxID=2249762 RepID=UPI000DE3058F|nr:TAXI family TRAP transporter solute-binding subunit [Nonomuraea lactucae]